MRTCAEETHDDNQRVIACLNEVVPGLPHCRAHAIARLQDGRERETELLERLKARAAMLVERELELAEIHDEDGRDRSSYLSIRSFVVRYRDALDQSTKP